MLLTDVEDAHGARKPPEGGDTAPLVVVPVNFADNEVASLLIFAAHAPPPADVGVGDVVVDEHAAVEKATAEDVLQVDGLFHAGYLVASLGVLCRGEVDAG